MTTESPVPKTKSPDTAQKALKILIKVLKVAWIPALLILALVIGLALGYEFITKTPGTNIFNKEIWQRFFEQLRALKGPPVN
ncbi:MAG: DNA-directed RNA polymerase subunit beta [Firmicutes bacterium]|nr:DNA-directed RNA polymerase subunit beta [Bacillota bacterium]